MSERTHARTRWRGRLSCLAGGLLVCILAGGMAAGCRHAADTGAAAKGEAEAKKDAALPQVAVATARVGAIEQILPVTGTLLALRDQQATISAPVAGVIDALPIRFGQRVERGQTLAHLSTRGLVGQIQQARAGIGQYTLQVQQAQANALQQQSQTRSAVLQAGSAASAAQAALLGTQATLTGYEATLANTRQSLARAQTLFSDGLLAKKDVDAAELAVRSAAAQVAAQQQTVAAQRQTVAGQRQAVAAAQAARLQDVVKQKDIAIARQQLQNARGALATAEAQLSLYTLRAPLSGAITSVNASVGEAVDTTTKIITIANLDRLQLQIAIPSASAASVHVGQGVTFTVDALPGRTFRAAIRTMGTQVDPANSTVAAIAAVVNRGHALKADLPARVGIVTARHVNVVLVPRAAVLIAAGTGAATASVLKIDKGNTVHKVEVKTGLSEGDRVEIRSGVRAGDRLATTGGYGLPDATKVQVSNGGGDPASGGPAKGKE